MFWKIWHLKMQLFFLTIVTKSRNVTFICHVATLSFKCYCLTFSLWLCLIIVALYIEIATSCLQVRLDVAALFLIIVTYVTPQFFARNCALLCDLTIWLWLLNLFNSSLNWTWQNFKPVFMYTFQFSICFKIDGHVSSPKNEIESKS